MNVPEDQVAVLTKLAARLPNDAYLAGDVAVLALLGHRVSRDLDIFTTESDPESLAPALGALPNTRITSRTRGTLYLEADGIPVSIIEHAYPPIDDFLRIPGLPLAIASAADLTAMKLHALASRGAARDFWDLHGLLAHRHATLERALLDHQARYPAEDLGHVIRSLVYFGDAERDPLPSGLDRARWAAIRHDFETWVKAL